MGRVVHDIFFSLIHKSVYIQECVDDASIASWEREYLVHIDTVFVQVPSLNIFEFFVLLKKILVSFYNLIRKITLFISDDLE